MVIVVVGGGVMGSAAAWRLARRGVTVTLFEQFQPGHTRGSSHGSSRIFRLAYPEPDYVRLAQAALPLWQELERETATSILDQTGAVDHGDPAEIERIEGALTQAGIAAQRLRPDQAQRRWPGLRFDTVALTHAEGGRLHADHAVAAMQQAARAHGARVAHGVRVTAVEDGEVRTDSGEVIAADAVVVAAGSWVQQLLGDLTVPVRVTREQPVHFPARDPATAWPSFIHHLGTASTGVSGAFGAYGLSSEDGIKVGFHATGPVIDPDEPDRIDPALVERVREYARDRVPGVDHTAGTPTTCRYTLTPDEDFIIDRLSGPITVISACSGHGFKFGPAVGELAAGLVLDERATPTRFRLARTAAFPASR